MDKVILIMDKPDCCGMCRLSGTGACRKWNMEDSGKFPKGCPLKPLPEKQSLDIATCNALNFSEKDMDMATGWNACIDRILEGGD